MHPVVVWRAPLSGPNSAQVWAPQIEYLGGHWYIYYSATSSSTATDHKLFAIVPKTPGDVLGAWVAASAAGAAGQLPTNWKSAWGIDPDVFRASDSNVYLTYSCRQSDDSTQSG